MNIVNIVSGILMIAVVFSVQSQSKECVVLLHGLARTDNSLSHVESSLIKSGYYIVNHKYPSTRKSIEELATTSIPEAIANCPDESTIHFVTHSMGGILVRQYLNTNSIEKIGRVVMLGPPNKGSQTVDKLKNIPGFKLINGPAGMQLGTGKMSIPNKLGPANFQVGVIAGTRSINLILSSMLPGHDDGKVTVENTKLEGMSDHIALPVTHPMMMRNKKVITQVKHFLEHGVFDKGE